ncbi:MAG TPA: FKBP-type peptidyl-prolyl cis-trans isomerase [Longimicrobium sp.]|jgi:FKBP-type peptidyl-prolyl cis-trans isomerase
MRVRSFLALASLCAVAAACENDPIGSGCRDVTNTTASTRGDTVITATGLRYLNLTVGSGATVESCRGVAVRYVGRLENGAVFDSVPTNAYYPFRPGVEPLIAGFEQGVVGMKEGGVRRLIIPASLGYGAAAQQARGGFSGIPANSTTIFDITVIEVEPQSGS